MRSRIGHILERLLAHGFILLLDLVARTYNLIAEPLIDIRSIGRSKLRFAGIGPLTQELQFFS